MMLKMRLAPLILRRLPPGVADLRVAHFVYRHWFAGSTRRTTMTLPGGARLHLDLSDWPQANTFLLGRYDVPSVEFIVRNLPPDGVFVDGGAHIGLVTLQVAARRPQAQIHSFEPHPLRGPALVKNAEMSRGDLNINLVGLSTQSTELPFDADAHKVGTGTMVIPVIALDDYVEEHGIGRIDVLKLDIEGHEESALRGARRMLEQGRIGAVIVETRPDHGGVRGVAAYLTQHGFAAVDPPDPRPRWIRAVRRWRPDDTGYLLGALPDG